MDSNNEELKKQSDEALGHKTSDVETDKVIKGYTITDDKAELIIGSMCSDKIEDNVVHLDLGKETSDNNNLTSAIELGPSDPYHEEDGGKDKSLMELLELNNAELEIIKQSLLFIVSEDRPQVVVDKNKKDPVLQDWVMNLNWKMQTGLISAIRGYDDDIEEINKDIKNVVRMIRYLILRNADGSTSFMTKYCIPEDNVVDALITHLKYCLEKNKSLHWLTHIHMAIFIIMDYHHSSYVKYYWLNIAKKLNIKIEEIL